MGSTMFAVFACCDVYQPRGSGPEIWVRTNERKLGDVQAANRDHAYEVARHMERTGTSTWALKEGEFLLVREVQR